MISLRRHVLTLVAVFLALAVGVVLGSTSVATSIRDAVVEREETTAARLELDALEDLNGRCAGLTAALPAEALVATEGMPFVWRVIRDDAGARVEQAPVQAAAPFRGRVSITHGLDAGDEVVIRGVKSLAPGQPVGRRLEP